MLRYRIHRMKSAARENFRWAPHTAGLAIVKSKDYEPGEELEAGNPYEIWKQMLQNGRQLHPGDLVEAVQPGVEGSVELRIIKYIGFEPAQWYVPEPKLTPSAPESVEKPSETVEA
jgi:hypothetical protein